MQSPFLFRRANVFEYTGRKGKKKPQTCSKCGLWYCLSGLPVLFQPRCHCEKENASRGNGSQGYYSMLTPSPFFMLCSGWSNFIPSDEKVKVSFPTPTPHPMCLAKDHEHFSLLLLFFGFLSIWDLWECIWKTFCISST